MSQASFRWSPSTARWARASRIAPVGSHRTNHGCAAMASSMGSSGRSPRRSARSWTLPSTKMVITAAPTNHGGERAVPVEELAVRNRLRLEWPSDDARADTETLHHLQEELGVRDAERVVPGLFLVDVGASAARTLMGGPCPSTRAKKHREIAARRSRNRDGSEWRAAPW